MMNYTHRVSLAAVLFGALSSVASAQIVINEIDYNQPGDDAAEFIELKNTSADALKLDNLVVEFRDGVDGSVYLAIPLTGELGAGEYLVICSEGSDIAGCTIKLPGNDIISNAPGSGLKIIDTTTGATLDSLAYGGDTKGFTEGSPLLLEDRGHLGGYGLSRRPDGEDTNDSAADWVVKHITPGAGGGYTPRCSFSDYDGDGDWGTDADIEAFFACLGGHCCLTCGSVDYNGDGDTGTDADIEIFLCAIGGGFCACLDLGPPCCP